MPKFNPKDLSYDQSLPPFLAALRGQLQGDGRGPDPILAGRRRTAKKRSASEEAEDAPLVVDEHGHAVDVAVRKDGEVETEEKTANEKAAEAADTKEKEKDADNVAFGAGKKRRVGKVVGGDEYEAAERELKRKRSEKEGKKDSKKDAKNKDGKKDKDAKKPKKEKKKIQLSFEDDED